VRILVPSIVDPQRHLGGAGTWTRGFISLLAKEPLGSEIECIVPVSTLSRFNRLRQATSLLRALASPLPSKALFLRTPSFRRTLARRLGDGGFDLVVINGGDLLWILDEIPAAMPVLLVAHNIEHALFASQIESLGLARGPLGRWLRRDWCKLRNYEVAGTERAGNVVFLSSDDADTMASLTSGLASICVPPLFDYEPCDRGLRRPPGSRLDVGMMANFTWWPNRVGLQWILCEVLPRVRRDLTLHLFGAGSAAAARGRSHVVGHGFVPELRAVWERCDFMLCPIVAGAGVTVKLAETVYNGVPVLATPFATHGLPVAECDAIVLLERAEQWAAFLDSPHADVLARAHVPRTVADRFSAASARGTLQAFVHDVATSTPRTRRASSRQCCERTVVA